VVLGGTGAYVAVRLGAHTGWSKRFKHEVLDWFGGDVDDAQTWMLATFASGTVLVLARLVLRNGGRTAPRPSVHSGRSARVARRRAGRSQMSTIT
jgi:hypothetical protein